MSSSSASATSASARAAAAAIAASLLHEPFYQAITVEREGDPAARLALLCDYMAYSMTEAGQSGRCVFAPDPADGAAVWTLPRPAEVAARESAAKAAYLRSTLGSRGYANYRRIVDFMEPLVEHVAAPEAWYLSILGVNPSAQGRGLGARLLQPTLEEADRGGIPCYVETFSERNRPFYRRAGFETVATHAEPTTGASYVIMLRERRPAAQR